MYVNPYDEIRSRILGSFDFLNNKKPSDTKDWNKLRKRMNDVVESKLYDERKLKKPIREIEGSFVSNEFKNIFYVRSEKEAAELIINTNLTKKETLIDLFDKPDDSRRDFPKTKDFFAFYCKGVGWKKFIAESRVEVQNKATLKSYKSHPSLISTTENNKEENERSKAISKLSKGKIISIVLILLITALTGFYMVQKRFLNSPTDIYSKGEYYLELNNWNKAIECFTRINEKFPNYSEVNFHLGFAYAKKQNLQEAIYYFEKAKGDDKLVKSKPIHVNLALLYYRCRNEEKAIENIKISQKKYDYRHSYHWLTKALHLYLVTDKQTFDNLFHEYQKQLDLFIKNPPPALFSRTPGAALVKKDSIEVLSFTKEALEANGGEFYLTLEEGGSTLFDAKRYFLSLIMLKCQNIMTDYNISYQIVFNGNFGISKESMESFMGSFSEWQDEEKLARVKTSIDLLLESPKYWDITSYVNAIPIALASVHLEYYLRNQPYANEMKSRLDNFMIEFEALTGNCLEFNEKQKNVLDDQLLDLMKIILQNYKNGKITFVDN